MADTEKLLTIPEAAAQLGVATATIRKWIFFRHLGCVRLSRRCVRIAPAELERVRRAGTVPALPNAHCDGGTGR
ncbi:MAG: helix-turn-helix transcriptional regulator [Terriglobales bacterium]